MDKKQTIAIFSALSQETRLRAYRLLVKAGRVGMMAGDISQALSVPHNTLSFHLAHLSQSGIIASRKEGRTVIYCANFEVIHQLITFLVEDCCSSDAASIKEDVSNNCSTIQLSHCFFDEK